MKPAIHRLLCVALLLTAATALHAQGRKVPLFGHPDQILSGYARSLQGEVLPYNSIYPEYVKQSLLTRCTDGNKVTEWETTPVPAGAKGPYVYFSWIAAHSSGTSRGTRHFDLYINDTFALTFTTHARQYPPYWSFGAADSTRLVFEFKKQDGALDAHGIAYLRVPRSRCQPGRPLKLRVTGQAQNSTDWYMTFMYGYEEKAAVEALPFLLRASGQQALLVSVLHFGPSRPVTVSAGGRRYRFTANEGMNSYEVPVKAVSNPQNLVVDVDIQNTLKVRKEVLLRPVIPRELCLVHHSHNDIGYSHLQETVAVIQNDNIRRALHLIGKTRSYPEGSRFVWNVESLWAVENFLHEATPAEAAQFVDAVKNRRIGLSALYANILTGLARPEELEWATDYARHLTRQYGLPIRTAMFTDIPGMSWSLVQALAHSGVRYFSNGPNYVEGLPGRGDRIGSTLLELGNRPFWWKSPAGTDSLLVWTCGKGYSSWHGFVPGTIFERGTRKIAAYVQELDSLRYPYSMVQWRYNIVADNGIVDSTICDFIKNWNERYSTPTLRLDNVEDLFVRFEQKYGSSLPVMSGDFTPYWEDGAYSTAREEGSVRMLTEKLLRIEQLAGQTGVPLPPDVHYRARRSIVMFHEHTWGSWCSISQPDDPFTVHQWEYKKRFADSAAYLVEKLERDLLAALPRTEGVTVYNNLPWVRSGYVETTLPGDFRGNALLDESGAFTPVQRLSNGKTAFIARNVPAGGRKSYRIPDRSTAAVFFRSPYAYAVDSSSGALSSLQAYDREWVGHPAYRGLFAALYVNGRDPGTFSAPRILGRETVESGPVVRTERIRCALEGTREVTYELSQYDDLDYLHCSITIDKKAVRDKEAVHVAFPLSVPSPVVRIGSGDTCYLPGPGQIPGANKDYFSVERWLDVSNATGGVSIACPQGALFETGSMNDERQVDNGYKKWKDRVAISDLLFLYALNNYWHTNYKADQEGRIPFDCYLRVHGPFDLGKTRRWGQETGQPLLCLPR